MENWHLRGLINNFNVLNPGDVLSDALTPRALNLSMTLNTPGDITTGLGDLTANAALTAQYLSGRGTMTTINTMQNSNPGDVVTIANPPVRLYLFWYSPFSQEVAKTWTHLYSFWK